MIDIMIPFLKRDVIGSGNMKKDIFCTITKYEQNPFSNVFAFFESKNFNRVYPV